MLSTSKTWLVFWAWAARKLCRILPPSLAFRVHHNFIRGLSGAHINFSEAPLFGPGSISGSFEFIEDMTFALHGSMNYLGMITARCFVNPGGRVFELGANRGTETYSLANIVGPSGSVIALEPDKITVEVLRDRVAKLNQVQIVEKAIANIAGQRIWNHNDFAPGSSFLGDDSPSTMGEVVETVTIDQLSDEYGEPQFIFIDIEGAEHQSLIGARHTLQTIRPVIFMEVNGSHLARAGASVAAIFQIICDYHYDAYDVNNRSIPQIKLNVIDEKMVTDWLILPKEMNLHVPNLRSTLWMARFMPRILGLNPLDR